MGELFTRRLAAAGLNLPIYRVLAVLWERGDQSLGDLAELTSAELSTLSRMAGRLTRRRLVTRTRVEGNGRTVRIALAPQGRRVVERFIPLAVLHERMSLRGFDAAGIARLKRDLAQVYRNLDAVEDDVVRSLWRTPRRRGGGKSSR